MKRLYLALSILMMAVLLLLLAAAASGAAPASDPVPNARPTPTAISPLPEPQQPQVAPESPDIPPLPDLIVESIRVIPAVPIIGESALIQVVIMNQSQYGIANPANNFFTDLYIDPGIVPIQLGQDGVTAWGCQATWMPAGGRHTLEFKYTFDDVRNFALWAQVDTDNTVIEANEHNNVTGPVNVQVRSRHSIVHDTHQDFQLGLASTLDGSHSEGVLRPGLFVEPWQEPPAVPIEDSIYRPDYKVDDAPDYSSEPTTWSQVKPAIASHGSQVFAVWEDGRNGGVFNRDIYFSHGQLLGDGSLTWGANVRVNWDDPIAHTANQVSPDIVYDPTHGGANGRLYVVWQDEREHPAIDSYYIYMAYSDDLGATWSPGLKINDDVGVATQLNPAVTVGRSISETENLPDPIPNHVYVVWQDRRNGNDDIYLARSDDSKTFMASCTSAGRIGATRCIPRSMSCGPSIRGRRSAWTCR
ncbi:MAG: CARDB domain-containing protein [Anaerolineae bacterium]